MIRPPVVIVHDERDGDAPERLEARIRAAGYDAIWRAGRDVLVGQRLHAEVAARMARGGPVVLCIGPETLLSGLADIVGTAALARHLGHAQSYLLPVRVGRGHAEHLFSTWGNPTVADCFTDFEAGAQRVLEALQRILPQEKVSSDTDRGRASPADDPLDAVLVRYLEAAREEHHNLPVAGYETEVKVPIVLSRVYVSLRARVHRALTPGGRRWGTHVHRKNPIAVQKAIPPEASRPGAPGEGAWFDGTRADGALDGDTLADNALVDNTRADGALAEDALEAEGMLEAPVTLEDAFRLARERFDLRGLVVVGDPGSGKTTLLKRLLLKCISHGSTSLGLPEDLIPVLLPLRYLKDPSRGLDHFLQDQLATNPHLQVPPDFGARLLKRGRLLILLDGLDEVADEATRAQVSRWIERAHTARPDCFFAVTSRFAGYQGKARFDGRFLELDVQPFDDDQARRFIHQWYETVEVGLRGDTQHARAQAQQQSERLWNGLTLEEFRSRRLRSLMGNPLLLTILCLVHRVRGSLPKRRAPLYRECVNVLLQHWQQAKELRLEVEGEQARQALQPVAWWMHQEEGRTRATTAELAPVLEQPLERLKVRLTAAQFLATIRDRSGLLVGWDVDSFGFMHLSFQEYLVALEAWSEDRLEAVAARFGESWWTEVILLLLAIPEKPVFERFMRCLLQTDRFVRQGELVGLCLEESFEVSPTPFLEVLDAEPRGAWERDYAALLALRHPVLKDSRDPRIVETCRRLTTSPHAPVRDLARELLAVRGMRVTTELKAGDVWVHEATGLEFVYVPAGSFWMGAEDITDSERPVHQVTFNRGYWIGKYPVTNEQYGRFTMATGRRAPQVWFFRQLNAAAQPVVGVNWVDAIAYCRWASGTLRLRSDLPVDGSDAIMLPSEAMWEYAARGPDGKKYPWGQKAPTTKRANYDAKVGQTTPVGSYPRGASWVGALDMAGNVWEWCADIWHSSYQDAPVDGSPWMSGGDQDRHVIRGGSWYYGGERLRTAYRFVRLSGYNSGGLGFRVALVSESYSWHTDN